MESKLENKESENNSLSEEEQDNDQLSQDDDSNENHDDNSSQANINVQGVERKRISKKRRRTKNDQSGRDFKCGCGKTYLSYPALYTHIKEKHNGQIPEGSSKPATNTKGNRGRPRKNDENCSHSRNEFPSVAEILKSPIGGNEESVETINADSSFPTSENFFVLESDYKSILNQIKAIIESGKSLDDESKNEQGLKETICTKILAYYILDNLEDLDLISFKELCAFTVFYQKALNNFGYKSIEALFKSWKQENPVKKIEGTDFCDCQNGFYILEVCNDLIEKNLKEFIVSMIKPDALKELRILSDLTIGFRDIINLFLNFAQWLKKNSFTNSRLTLN